MKLKNSMKLEFMSLPENVALARIAVATFATKLDFTLEDIEEIKVAISEGVSNCIIHGYQNRPDGLVQLQCSIVEQALYISITDQGVGIEDLARAMEPAYSTDPERMGLGFAFMQSFMTGFEVKSEPGKGTTLMMHKVKPAVNSDVAMGEN